MEIRYYFWQHNKETGTYVNFSCVEVHTSTLKLSYIICINIDDCMKRKGADDSYLTSDGRTCYLLHSYLPMLFKSLHFIWCTKEHANSQPTSSWKRKVDFPRAQTNNFNNARMNWIQPLILSQAAINCTEDGTSLQSSLESWLSISQEMPTKMIHVQGKKLCSLHYMMSIR